MKYWKDSLSKYLTDYQELIARRDAKIASLLYFDLKASNLSTETEHAQDCTNADLALPFAVKDNIAVQGMPLSCGSKFLKTYISPYNATAVEKLLRKGARVVGKTNLDEFGMGSSTDNSALAQTNNPWDIQRVSGGSSGGSAAAVAAGLVPFALGSDTGGSVRQPAGFCGVYGLKPTYGTVSRYGLVAYASSLDVIGVCSKNLSLCRGVYQAICGRDDMDQTSVDHPQFNSQTNTSNSAKSSRSPKKKLAVLAGELGLSSEISRAYKQSAESLKKCYLVEEVQIPLMEYAIPVYYIIACAEASANLARFNGIRYGTRPVYAENPEMLMRRARQEGFGEEVKLRILLGTYVLRSGFQDRYYNKAQQIRKKLRSEFSKLFLGFDAILMPTYPVQAFLHGEASLDSFQQKLADKFTTTANLIGAPALACPAGIENGLPCSVQIMSADFGEEILFEVASELAKDFPINDPPGFENYFSL